MERSIQGPLWAIFEGFQAHNCIKYFRYLYKTPKLTPIATNATISIATTTLSTPATTVSIPGDTASTATITFSVMASTGIDCYYWDCKRHGGSSHCGATAATCPSTTITITNLNATSLSLR